MLANRLVRVYPYMCLSRLPKCGTCKAASRVANSHFDFMGRRSQASTVPPGYVHALSLPRVWWGANRYRRLASFLNAHSQFRLSHHWL